MAAIPGAGGAPSSEKWGPSVGTKQRPAVRRQSHLRTRPVPFPLTLVVDLARCRLPFHLPRGVPARSHTRSPVLVMLPNCRWGNQGTTRARAALEATGRG